MATKIPLTKNVYAITYHVVVEWGNAAGIPFSFGVHNGVDLFVEFPT